MMSLTFNVPSSELDSVEARYTHEVAPNFLTYLSDTFSKLKLTVLVLDSGRSELFKSAPF